MNIQKYSSLFLSACICAGCAVKVENSSDNGCGKDSPKVIRINPAWKPIRDISASTCAPILGYAGSLENDDCKTYFETDRENTARAFRLAGARFVRQWAAVSHWQLGAGAEASHIKGTPWKGPATAFTAGSYANGTDMKNVFSFYKEYGIKVILTLENYNVFTNDYTNGEIDFKTYTRMSDKSKVFGRTSDIKYVKKVICDYVRWIVENDFTGVVGGLELGNEPYGMPVNKAEEYAKRWTVIVNEIKKIWPKAPIGIAIGEYFENDPDIAAIRNRALSANPLQRKTYFSAGELNRWSARYIIAMSNCMDNITHVIYHTYGAERPFSATYDGLIRYRRFNQAFPELGNKPIWITEWRDRSDEDNWSHQRFRDTLTKTGYMMMMVSQPDIECMNLHQFTSLSGAFHAAVKGKKRADGTYTDGTWSCHWDGHCRWRTNFDDIHKTYLEPGMMGPAMRLMVESFRREPLVLDFGSEKHGAFSEGCSNAVYACSEYYEDFTSRFRMELRRGKSWNEIEPSGSDCEYIVTVDKKRTYMTFLAVNYKNKEVKFDLRLPTGWGINPYEYRVYDCPEKFLDVHEVPGEPRFTRRYGYQTLNHYRSVRAGAGPAILTIPANSVTAVRIPIYRKHTNAMLGEEITKSRLFNKGDVQFCAIKYGRVIGEAGTSKALFPMGDVAGAIAGAGDEIDEVIKKSGFTNNVVCVSSKTPEGVLANIKGTEKAVPGKVYASARGASSIISYITGLNKQIRRKKGESVTLPDVTKFKFKKIADGAFLLEDSSGLFRAYCEPATGLVVSYVCTFKDKEEIDKLFRAMILGVGVRAFEKEPDVFASLPAAKR